MGSRRAGATAVGRAVRDPELPAGFVPDLVGQLLDCKAGQTLKVEFKLQKAKAAGGEGAKMIVPDAVAPADRRVSLKLRSVPFQDALKELCQQADLKLELDGNGLKLLGFTKNQPVTTELKDVTLQQALDKMLENFPGISFVIDDNSLFVSNHEAVGVREGEMIERENAAGRSEQAKPDEPSKAPAFAVDPMRGKAPGEVRDDNGLKLKLVWCPPGSFTMEQFEDIKEPAAKKDDDGDGPKEKPAPKLRTATKITPVKEFP